MFITFETTVSASTVQDFVYTNSISAVGSYSDFLSVTYTYSASFYAAQDTDGGGTSISEFSPWDDFRGGDGAGITWWWADQIFDQVYQRTVITDILGTSITDGYVGFSGNDEFITAIFPLTSITSYPNESNVETTLKFWTTQDVTRIGATTAEETHADSVWTYVNSENSWKTTERQTTSLGIATFNGLLQQITTTEGEAITITEASKILITASSATYNTLLLVSDVSDSTIPPYVLKTTDTVGPKLSATTTTYGLMPFLEFPTLTLNFGDNNSFESGYYEKLEGGNAGYETTLITVTSLDNVTFTWIPTVLSEESLAGISYSPIATSNNPPIATNGLVVKTSDVSPETLSQQTTTTTAVTALTHGEFTTTLSSFETISLGEGQTTKLVKVSTIIDTFIDQTWLGFLEFNKGFSLTSENVVNWPFNSNQQISISISQSYISVSTGTIKGFYSSLADLNTTRIDTIRFAVVGENGNNGTSYVNGNEFNTISDRSIFFAPKKPQEFLPISGSASSSNESQSFSMRYYEATQSRTTTFAFGENTSAESETSAWEAVGSAETFWVDVSRKQLAVYPSPSISALQIAGQGQAFLPEGLYETYGAGESGSNSFISTNEVLSFSVSGVPTAIKPIKYFFESEGFGSVSTSTANNFNDQPIDD
jgi:hypothetical protein